MRTSATIVVGLCLALFAAVPACAGVKICNDAKANLHVALASETPAGFAVAGWWSAAPNTCVETEFTLVGGVIYYTAESDSYRDGSRTLRDHWGNKLKLYVSRSNFTAQNAEKPRRGAHGEMFSSADTGQTASGKPATITVRFHPGGTSIQSVTSPN